MKDQAEDALRREDWPEARRLWREFSDKHPDLVWGHYWLAYIEGRTGNLDGSVAMFEAVRHLDTVAVTNRLVEVHAERGDYERGLEELKRLIGLGKTAPDEIRRLSLELIRTALGGPGYPPSVFDLDPVLTAVVRV